MTNLWPTSFHISVSTEWGHVEDLQHAPVWQSLQHPTDYSNMVHNRKSHNVVSKVTTTSQTK